jgi:predicted DNA repair protein MutK
MSGLLALLDDVAAIAKVAAASLDDIAAGAAKAGVKVAGVVIDDAAVTPKYVGGFEADRELPIIWRIARGSIRNKLIVLLPSLLALNHFLPAAITPLLMLGGAYLCFEGAEKLYHVAFPHGDAEVSQDFDTKDPAHIEEEKIAGAIKTDFILSAEIMTIALAAIPANSFWIEAVTLAVVGVMITVMVYGAVALIVKMDDVGLHLAKTRKTAFARAFGRGLVVAMPRLMAFLSVVGTAAMLWVGGSIIIHGMDVLGQHEPYATIHHWAQAAGAALPRAQGFVEWAVIALSDGILGAVFGFALIPLATRIVGPLWVRLWGKQKAAQ